MDKQPIKETRQVSLTLHFTVEVDESSIPTDGVNARPNGTIRSGDDEAWREGDEMERRLLHAVIAQKQAADAYLLYAVVSQLSGWPWQDWHELLLGDAQEDIEKVLLPAIKTLSSEDQEHFAHAKASGVFFECTEAFQDCWSVRLDTTKVVIKDSNHDTDAHQ